MTHDVHVLVFKMGLGLGSVVGMLIIFEVWMFEVCR
jgi:hypothetical protein